MAEYEYPFTIPYADAAALSREFSVDLAREVTVTYITPGQADDDGNPIPAVLWIINHDGTETFVPPAQVDRLLKAHVPPPPPPTPEEIRTKLKADLDNASTLPTVKDVLKRIIDQTVR